MNNKPRASSHQLSLHTQVGTLTSVDVVNSAATNRTFLDCIYYFWHWVEGYIKDKLKLILKPLSDTRWKNKKAAAIKITFLQFNITDCVDSLKNSHFWVYCCSKLSIKFYM